VRIIETLTSWSSCTVRHGAAHAYVRLVIVGEIRGRTRDIVFQANKKSGAQQSVTLIAAALPASRGADIVTGRGAGNRHSSLGTSAVEGTLAECNRFASLAALYWRSLPSTSDS
jgi:hypothetical protein